jgi:hypothetical protein
MGSPFLAHAIVVEALDTRRFVRVMLPYRREGLRELDWGLPARAATLATAMATAARHAQAQASLPFSRRAFAAPSERPDGAPWPDADLLEAGVVVVLHRSSQYGVILDAAVPNRAFRSFEGIERRVLPLRTSFRALATATEALVKKWRTHAIAPKRAPGAEDELANTKAPPPEGVRSTKRSPRARRH